MLYPENCSSALAQELFRNPTAEYRGTPFWAWNCPVTKELVCKQIDDLKAMGMGGFHIHSRTGMTVPYLGDAFMDLVRTANEKGKVNQMMTWLYDEDRCPSGAAGGLVTKDIRYRARRLCLTPRAYPDSQYRRLLAQYQIVLENGRLASYHRLDSDEQPVPGARLWRAYLEIAEDNPIFNNQAYVNTLDPLAIQKFIEITYDRYAEVFQDEFGRSMPAIFTDEPQFFPRQCLKFAADENDVRLPFTDDFETTYQTAYGDSLLDHLPELIWDFPGGKISLSRYRYHEHSSERLAAAFADQIGSWCQGHGIMLTGHLMCESSLYAQTLSIGEAMRSYRSFQLPGIDMLCDWREYSTAKQAQSAAHQYGRPGVTSELYGVTNWDFDFRGHKLQGDWQAALGVTVRVHHLTWMSMAGRAKRDYPASIGYQSPWYKEYPLIEDHYSRLNTALTRGKPRVRVGVIHPIESYWLHWGPNEQTAGIRQELDKQFEDVIEWLLFGLIDFDFIAESLLPELTEVAGSPICRVGVMHYEAILVPGCETLRSITVDWLETCQKAGVPVIFAGPPARLIDAAPSDRAIGLARQCTSLPLTRCSLLQALDGLRDLDIRQADGRRTENLLYQMREDGERRWLFIGQGRTMKNPDIALAESIRIKIRGAWRPTVYDTISGAITSCQAAFAAGSTIIERPFFAHDSLLLALDPGLPDNQSDCPELPESVFHSMLAKSAVPVTLAEPNVLLLDMAEYSFDGGSWQGKDEILRIDNRFRQHLGYPSRTESVAQPWACPDESTPEHRLGLRFTIWSDIEVTEAYLGLENTEMAKISINGQAVPARVAGWYVDECIKKVPIPALPKGRSEIIIDLPFARQIDTEWCYLLGDFGVRVDGSEARIIEPVRQLHFGDWTRQGLPFYAGNLTYHCPLPEQDAHWILEVPQFRNTLLTVAVGGVERGKIALAPYRLDLAPEFDLDLNRPAQLPRTVEITAFGNRVNAFGAVHNCNRSTTWFGPDAWFSTGSSWSDEYQLKPSGILVSPRLYIQPRFHQ